MCTKFSLGNLSGAPYSVVVLSVVVRTVRNVGPLSFLVILSVRHPLHLNNIEINLGSEVGRMRTEKNTQVRNALWLARTAQIST